MNEFDWLLKLKEFKGEEQLGSNHHLLPRFYMANFANEKLKVGTKNRLDGESRLNLSPNKILIQRNFDSFINLDMEADGSVEVLISKIEGMACEVIKRRLTVFQKFPIDNDDSWALSYFAALQLLRGRRMRRTIEILCDFYAKFKFVGLDERNAREFLMTNGIEPTNEEVTKLLDFKEQLPDIFITPSTNDHIQFLLLSISSWASMFRRRPISLVKFDKPILVTSDEPLLFYHEYGYRKSGIATSEEIHLPISPQHLLIFGASGSMNSQFFLCPSVKFNSKEFNKAMFNNCHELIVFNPDFSYRGLGKLPTKEPILEVLATKEFILENFKENSLLRNPLARFQNVKESE